MSEMKIQGVLAPNIVPFTSDGEVDEKRLKEYVCWLVDKGIDCLYPIGSFGSAYLMSVEERKRCVEAIAERVEGRIPIICHIGAQNTRDSVKLAKHAEKTGVYAIASLPPILYKHARENVKAYFQDLIDAVSLPVFAYNYPKAVGYEISVDLLAELADIGLAGIKDSSLDLFYFQQAMNAVKKRDFVWMNGMASLMLPAMLLGAVACVAGTANAFPEFTLSLWKAIQKREYEKAAELQRKVTRLVQLINITTNIIGIHEMLWLRGFDFGGYPRAPMKPYTEQQRAILKRGLMELGLMD